jgi:Na+/melibiose symporter-like transporter
MTALPAGFADAPLEQTDVVKPALGTGERLKGSMLAVFSGPSLPISALGLPLSVYLPEFYANVIGVKLATVALIFLCIRLVDLSIDPLLGGLMDRTRTPLGRFKPWLALGAPLVMLAAYMTFMARPGSGPLHLAFWLFGLYIAYSILVLSHSAWASTLTGAYHERSRVYGWMQGGLVLSMVLVPAIAAVAASGHGRAPGAGVRGIGWFIIVLAPVTIALACWRVPETVPSGRAAKGPGLRDYLRLALRPTVARILVADLCLAFAPAVTAALFFFFFREARGFSTAQANILLVLYFVGGLLGAPLWTRLARQVGKHRSLQVAALYYVVMQLMVIAPPKGALIPGAIVLFLSGVAYSAPTILIRAMMADAADEADLDQGKKSTGMLYAMISSTAKISSALGIFITFSVLGAVGFAPKAHALNTPGALAGLTALFVALPVVAALMGAGALFGYTLDEGRHGAIRKALDQR